MSKREPIPAIRPRDALFQSTGTEAVSATVTPAHVKTSAYVRPDQVTLLDEHRAAHRAAGRRTVSASDLVRAALDLAAKHGEEWDQLVVEAAEAR